MTLSKKYQNEEGWEKKWNEISKFKDYTYGIWKSVDGQPPLIIKSESSSEFESSSEDDSD